MMKGLRILGKIPLEFFLLTTVPIIDENETKMQWDHAKCGHMGVSVAKSSSNDVCVLLILPALVYLEAS